MNKKIISFIITFIMVISPFNLVRAEEHWASNEINYLLEKGIIAGDGNGIRPDDQITRAEFAKVINKLFGFSAVSNLKFNDVNSDKWYYDDMHIAKQSGYMKGDENGNVNPEGNLSRVEASVVYARLLFLDTTTETISLNDGNLIPTWGKGSVAALIKSGIIKGYSDGEFKPNNNMTRAEVFSTLVRAEKLKYPGETTQSVATVASLNTLGGSSSAGAGGSSGGGNTGSSTKTEFTRINTETFDVTWKSKSGASSYTIKLLRTTNHLQQEESITVFTTSTNIKSKLDEMTKSRRFITETFQLAVKSNLDSSYSSWSDLNFKYPAIEIPEDLQSATEISDLAEEKVYITWTVEEAAKNYELSVKFTEDSGFVALSYIITNGKAKAEVPSIYLQRLDKTHELKFQGFSNNTQILDSERLEKPIEMPIYGGGKGTLKEPYILKNGRHFNNIRKNPEAFYTVNSDIVIPSDYIPFEFSGKLIGDKTDSTNLRKITVSIDSTNLTQKTNVGLFTTLTSGTVKNISIDGLVKGTNYVGAFAGTSTGNIENCINYASVTGVDSVGGIIGSTTAGEIFNTINYGTVAARTNAAGIVGVLNGATIRNTANVGELECSGSNIGGIVGLAYQGVKNCFNTGNITGGGKVGGIVGYCAGKNTTIEDCYNIANINSTTDGSENMAGGILGGVWIDNNRNMNIKSCYNIGAVKTVAKSFDPIYPGFSPYSTSNYIYATDCYYLSESKQDDGKANTTACTSEELKNVRFLSGNLVMNSLTPYEYHEIVGFPHTQKAIQLSTPVITQIDKTDEFVNVLINGHDKTKNYTIAVYDDDKLTSKIGEITSTTGGAQQTIDIKNLLSEFKQYYLTVTANGDQYFYITSELLKYSYTYKAISLPQPILLGKPSWEEIDMVEEYKISWESINNKKLSAFEVKLYESGNLVKTEYLDKTANFYELKEENGISFGGGYTIKLRAISENEEENSDEVSVSFDTMFVEGAGTKEDPYILKNARHFRNIENKSAAYYLVAANIDLTGGYTPFSFQGQITGGKTTMMDLYSIKVDLKGNSETVGLFTELAAGSKISYLELQGTVTNGFNYTGGFAGKIAANVTLSNCINRANITSALNYVGGLVGYSNSASGRIENCYNYGTISGNSTVGGLVGSCYATVTDSGNYGFVTAKSNHLGGVAGYLLGNVLKSFNAGKIVATSSSANTQIAGGIVGTVPANIPDGRKIENCFNVGEIEAPLGSAAGIIASVLKSSFTISNCYHAGKLLYPGNNYYPISAIGKLSNCYYLSETEASDSVEQTTALKEEDMKNLEKFENWDHGKENSIWILYTNDGYFYPQISGNLYVKLVQE